MAQLVEHILGKDEVPGPNPGSSSRHPRGFYLGALVFYGLLPHPAPWHTTALRPIHGVRSCYHTLGTALPTTTVRFTAKARHEEVTKQATRSYPVGKIRFAAFAHIGRISGFTTSMSPPRAYRIAQTPPRFLPRGFGFLWAPSPSRTVAHDSTPPDTRCPELLPHARYGFADNHRSLYRESTARRSHETSHSVLPRRQNPVRSIRPHRANIRVYYINVASASLSHKHRHPRGLSVMLLTEHSR